MMQAQLSPARIEAILTAVRGVREGQSLTVKQFQKLLGLMAAASNVIPFGLLYMRPLQVAQDQGVFPEGESASHDQCHAAMLTCLRHVEENLVPVSRPGVGGSLSSCNANDGRLRHVLGSGHEWPFCPRSVGRPSSIVTHQLPGDVGRVSSSKTLPSRLKGTSCACPHRQHIGGLLHKSAGGSALAPWLVHLVLLWAQGKLLSLRAVYIPGHLNQGADILSRQGLRPREWRLHPEVVELLWEEFGQAEVDIFASQ